MELKDYSIEELKAELKRRSDLAKTEKAKVNCEHFEEKGENIMTREEIEQLNEIEPYCFETDREEQWYRVGLQEGLSIADANPKSPWISVDDDLPCNHEKLVHSNYTDRVLVLSRNGYSEVAFMCIIEDVWEWNTLITVLYWMPIPKLPKE